MTVTATVIADAQMTAIIACIHMTTQCRSTALFNGMEHQKMML
jgi:hypothetical protein